MKQDMTATVKAINQNFIIRLRWVNIPNSSKLVGAGTYAKHLGDEKLAQKHFNSVLERGTDKHTFSLRRGLKIDFYSK